MQETTIEFYYDGPVVSYPVDPGDYGYEESKSAVDANLEAHTLATRAALELNILQCHEYSWPDGSLFLRFKTDLPDNELIALLNSKLPTEKISAIKAYHYPMSEYKVYHWPDEVDANGMAGSAPE